MNGQSLRRAFLNAFLWVDIHANKATYIRLLQENGFLVDERTTCCDLYLFFSRI